MLDVHRIGFTRLPGEENTRNGPYRVNIVLVHGLRGHPVHTWEDSREVHSKDERTVTSSKRGFLKSFFKTTQRVSDTDEGNEESSASRMLFWPDEYLTQDIPEARVWTYGYNADAIDSLFRANNKNSVSQHGRDLAIKISRDIENEDPILFVAHSLGGIIVKDAMHKSDVCRSRTKLIIFLGTPHRGSASAGWGEIASNLARLALQDSNKKIVETLEVNSEVLDNIHEEFKIIVHDCGTKIHSFQEARGISGMKGLHNKVVDDFSSKLDLPRTLEMVESIDANHMQMARCSDRTDARYRAILGVLKQFMRSGALDGDGSRPQEMPSTTSRVETQGAAAVGELSGTPYNRVWPRCHYIPFPKNKRFVGREKNLDALKQTLFIQKNCQKVALVGLGGIGKTQVGLQFAYWAKENMPEYSIFWVPALSDGSFEQAYTEIARELAIRPNAENEDLKESVRQYLSSERAGPWLLIVDNADDMDVLFAPSGESGGIIKYLPENENGLILFTTRSREVAVSMSGSDVVELCEMDSQEATSFLEKSLIRKSLLRDTAAATELLDELTHLPLAITQAAAYLNTNQVSISEYLELLRGTEQDMIGLMSRTFHDNTRYRGSQNAVAATWIVSFDRIRKSHSIAADLLSFMSRIEPKAIPRSILPKPQSEEQMVHAIGTLCAYAFVVRRGESKIFDMHGLVHLAARIWVEKHGLAGQTTKNAIKHLAEVFPLFNYANRDLWREYLPHALRVLQTSTGLDIEERYDLYLRVGLCLQADGRIKEAVKYVEMCDEWRKGRFMEDNPSRLVSQHALAEAYKQNGQVKEAVELLKHIVTVEERTLAEDHPDRLASQHALAVIYRQNGQVKEAVELLKHVVTVNGRTLVEDHPDRLASQHALAETYGQNGQVKKAVELLKHVVAVEEGTLAEDHPDRLASQHALAITYGQNGQVKEAVELLKHVVAVKERTLAEDHPDRLASQHALATTYGQNGQVKEAVELFKHVVAIRESTLAEDHFSRLASQHGLAITYGQNGQVKEAVELFKHVVTVNGRTLAEDHPNRLASQHALAITYGQNGKVKEAVELLEHVVAVEERTLAEDHPDRLASQHALAGAYRRNGQVKEAVELLKHVVAVRESTLAEDHPDRLASQRELVYIYALLAALPDDVS